MVFVRKTELACRNDWAQDLWEESLISLNGHGDDVQVVSLGLNGGSDGTATEAEQGEADDPLRSGDLYTDRVKSITMTTRPPGRPATLAAADVEDVNERREMAAALDARSAVREARRRRQEQRNEEQKRLQLVEREKVETLLTDGADAAGASPVARDQPREPGGEPTQRSTVSKPAPVSRRKPPTERPVADAPSAPKRSRVVEPSIEYRARPASFGNAARSNQPPAERTPRRDLPPQPKREPDELLARSAPTVARRHDPPAEPAPESPPARPSRRRPAIQPTEPLPTREVRERLARRDEVPEDIVLSPPPAARAPKPGSIPRDGASRPRQPAPEIEPPLPPRDPRWLAVAGEVGRRTRAPEAASDVEALPVDPIDASPRLVGVPRCCGTCRSFKRDGDTDRGWCAKGYALPEARMVQSSELACRSTLGVWWLPHDDLWLERADTSHHGRPTPLLDELLGDGPARRQGMGSRSR